MRNVACPYNLAIVHQTTIILRWTIRLHRRIVRCYNFHSFPCSCHCVVQVYMKQWQKNKSTIAANYMHVLAVSYATLSFPWSPINYYISRSHHMFLQIYAIFCQDRISLSYRHCTVSICISSPLDRINCFRGCVTTEHSQK